MTEANFPSKSVSQRPVQRRSDSRMVHLQELARWAGIEWCVPSMHIIAENAINRAADLKEEIAQLRAALRDIADEYGPAFPTLRSQIETLLVSSPGETGSQS
jgi:hypothetical protein